jgi:phosphodiesterase/alkaline phosphatase D-like protein
VGTTTATLNGTVNANGADATVTFEYGLTAAYGKTAFALPGTVTGSSNAAVTALLSDLAPDTTYHFRVVAVNAGGTAQGADMTFTTLAAPVVTTLEASGVSTSGATLNGTVNAKGISTAATFQYGLTTAYGTTVTADQSPVTGSSDTAVSRSVTGLSADTVYHYRAVGQNAQGTTYGGDRTFVTTVGAAPIVTTNAATSVLYNGATLNGTVTANNSSTTVTFEYGTTAAYGTTVTADQSPVTGVGVPVSKIITGLGFNTTYHYRVVGTNANGTGAGADMTFTTTLNPAVMVSPATNVLSTSATLNGMVNANSLLLNVYFEYSTDLSYGSSVPATPNSVSGSSDTPVSADVTGLIPNTLYNYRVRAYSGLSYYSGNMTFTTLMGPAVTTNAASSVGGNTATFNGTVNANHNDTGVIFEYGETTGYGRTIAAEPGTVGGAVDTAVSAVGADLIPSTTYHYRAAGQNAEGTVYGNDMSFTTAAAPPTAVTDAATAVTTSGATLNGTVNAGNDTATVTFEYGLTASYGSAVTAVQSPITGVVGTAVSAALSGLSADTVYHYRVTARNGSGTTNGADMTFFTGVLPPSATTGEATDIGSDGATLHGTVNAHNGGTVVIFEYGETTGYGRTVAAGQSPVTGAADTAVSAGIDLLDAETLYHYRVCAENSAGKTCGADRTFTTSPAGLPVVTTADVTAVTAMSATGGGNVTDTGYYPMSARGVCWSTSLHPTVADSNTSEGARGGAFTSTLTGLSPNTSYYVRAYATNAAGTAYGRDVIFSTTGDEAIPALSEWGLIVFALLMAGAGIAFIRKRKDTAA